MTTTITLIGQGGVLADHAVDVEDGADADAVVTAALAELLAHSWVLSPGDTITITGS